AQAVHSKYTTILLETMLIGYKDVQNLETMSGLQKVVHPLYDDLKKLRGLNAVTEHLEYVRAKQVGYANRNIVKYL
ncbi:RepB protein, partial [Enterococcus faecalis]